MINSLQSVRTEDIGSNEFLQVMIPILRDSLRRDSPTITSQTDAQSSHFPYGTSVQVLSSREISMILYSLKGFRSEQSGDTLSSSK